MKNIAGGGPDKEQGVIGVLQYGAWRVRDGECWRQGGRGTATAVPLAQAALVVDPGTREAIGDRGRGSHGPEDEAVPGDGVEGFGEVEHEDTGEALALVAALDKFGAVDDVLRDRTSPDEARSVDVHQLRDLALELGRQHLREHLDREVLEGDRPECIRRKRSRVLGDEDDVCTVETLEVDVARLEAVKKVHQVVGDRGPSGLVEGSADAVGAGVLWVFIAKTARRGSSQVKGAMRSVSWARGRSG